MLYLAWFDAPDVAANTLAQDYDGFALAEGLMLVETAATRSKLYHSLKRALPDGAPLMVAPLDAAPKFKGLAPGALAWVRARGGDV